MKPLAFLLCAIVAVSACAPVSPERAADLCEERARAAQGVTGEVGIGVAGGSGRQTGLVTNVDVGFSLSSDTIRGRDPYQVYDRCVRDKTGQGPIRPLIL